LLDLLISSLLALGLRLVASVPELWLTSLGLGSQMLCTFFYDASLAEHIIRVDRSPMLAGSLISITAITCTCTSPLWGFLVDRSGRRGFAEFLLLGGALGAALFALLIGPSPLIGFFQLWAIGLITSCICLIFCHSIPGAFHCWRWPLPSRACL
jgi:MFS family permease